MENELVLAMIKLKIAELAELQISCVFAFFMQ
jgi:hypothetical protein